MDGREGGEELIALDGESAPWSRERAALEAQEEDAARV
jgi:hypothetical protein